MSIRSLVRLGFVGAGGERQAEGHQELSKNDVTWWVKQALGLEANSGWQERQWDFTRGRLFRGGEAKTETMKLLRRLRLVSIGWRGLTIPL